MTIRTIRPFFLLLLSTDIRLYLHTVHRDPTSAGLFTRRAEKETSVRYIELSEARRKRRERVAAAGRKNERYQRVPTRDRYPLIKNRRNTKRGREQRRRRRRTSRIPRATPRSFRETTLSHVSHRSSVDTSCSSDEEKDKDRRMRTRRRRRRGGTTRARVTRGSWRQWEERPELLAIDGDEI